MSVTKYQEDRDLIQFKNEWSWKYAGIHKPVVINVLVSLSLDRDTVHSDFIQITYQRDQTNEKDYSLERHWNLFQDVTSRHAL